MIQHLGFRATFIILILCAASGQAAVDDLTEIVPTGAPVVYYVADVPNTIDEWAKSPLAELWNDPQVRAFFAPLRKELEIDTWDTTVKKETGYSLEEIKGMLTGDLVVYLGDMELILEEGAEDLDFSMTMLATVGDNASKFEKLILEQKEKAAEKAEADDGEAETTTEIREFRGIDIHVESTYEGDDLTDETGWAVVDGVFAFSSPVKALETAITSILDGGVDNQLRSGVNFRTVSQHTRGADSWFFMDIDPWIPMVRTALDKGLAAAQEAGSPFPMDPATLMDALGVEAMQALFATFDLDDQTMAMDLGLTYTEDRGLIKLLAYGPEEAPRSTFIPIDSDGFSTAQFDFGGAWSALVNIVNGVNPALMGMAAMQLESMVQGAGAELDLKRDLLENLTGEMASIQNLDGIVGESIADLQLEQDQIFALGIHQREALENTIETIKGMVGQGSQFFSERDFEGHTIFTLDLPQAEGQAQGAGFAYVVTDAYCLISMGSPATLEKVLLKIGTKGKSVWKQQPVRRAFGLLPEGAASLQYQDLVSIGDLIFHAISVADNFKGDNDGEDFEICDPSAKPDSGVLGKYLSSGVSGVWKDDKGIVIRSLVLPADRD